MASFVIVFFAFLLTAGSVAASDLPDWVDRPPHADSTYRYYVGRAVAEVAEPQAYRDATHDAMEAAIRENFGVITSIHVTDYETTTQHSLDRRSDEASSRVNLEEFEQIDSQLTRSGNGISVYLLYRYPLTAIEKEKARLAIGGELAGPPVSEAGQLGAEGELRVESVPPGAEIFVDSERWGLTPVILRGVLQPGRHQLLLRSTNFEDIEEEFLLAVKEKKRIVKILKPATTTLKIATTPTRALVRIDGVQRGYSPLVIKNVPVGKNVFIEAAFNDHDVMSVQIKPQKNEVREIQLDLPQPIATSAPQNFSMPVADHARASRADHLIDTSAYQSASIFGLAIEYSGANIPKPYAQPVVTFGASYEKRFLYRFGLRVEAGFDEGAGVQSSNQSSSQSSSGSNTSLSGLSYGVGLPIYLTASPGSLYLMPEYGGISYLCPQLLSSNGSSVPASIPPQIRTASGTANEDISFVYPRAGFTLGYQDQLRHFNIFASGYDYDWGKLGRHHSASVGLAYVFGK